MRVDQVKTALLDTQEQELLGKLRIKALNEAKEIVRVEVTE